MLTEDSFSEFGTFWKAAAISDEFRLVSDIRIGVSDDEMLEKNLRTAAHYLLRKAINDPIQRLMLTILQLEK